MQDVHPTVAGVGIRRLSHHQTAALKCPRCESLNTKFCYYNNYNLSQPRHFCKHCRRYWTNGGVLRNVPVGGGSRKKKPKPKPKPKQSLSLSSSSADSTTTTTVAGGNCGPNGAALEEVLLAPEPNGAVLEEILLPSEIGGFVSSSDPDPDLLGFIGSATSYGELLDPTVRIDDDVVENRGSNGGGVALDWQQLADQNVLGLFDLDDRANWTQPTTSFQEWSDNNSINNNHNHDYLSLFLP